MFEDDEKEFDPSESEEFLKAINEVLDLPDEYETDKINLDTSKSQLIDIPDGTEEKEDVVSDSEFDICDAALTQSLADMFEEAASTEETPKEDVVGSDSVEECKAEQEKNDTITSEEDVSDADDDAVVLTEAEKTDEEAPEAEETEATEPTEELLLSETVNENEFPEGDAAEEQDIIDDINAALALQVNEMSAAGQRQKNSKKWLLTLIPIAGIAFLFTRFREGMPKWLMGIRIAVFSVFALFLIGTVATGGKLIFDIAGIYSRWRMTGEATTPTPPVKPGNNSEISGPTNAPVIQPTDDEPDSPVQPSVNPPREEEHIVNILLLGEEKINSGNARGRTDLIMIATLDTEQRTVKLTSIMRDILVAIPGHSDDRINSVYGKGGIELLKEVIALNFEIVPDGYMLVDFESFEQIIDNLDGVTIELSAEEADYLNTTNYISNPIYRNVVPGLNKMNGNQALGYCRVRHVPTIDNVHSDFGRTSRQRVVLNAIFEKMKTKNLFQLAIVANSCLPLVETDLSASQISDYMEKAVESKITNFVQMRIPINGTYRDATYNGIPDLIQINFPENIKALHEFIFGDYKNN